MEIRDERPGDEDAIRRVHLEAFGGDLEARLVDLLRARKKAVTSLVADERGGVVGHIMFSPVTIERQANCRALGLAPVAVSPPFQNRGIGSDLIREGVRQCQRSGCHLVVLVGAPDYYQRFGFRAAKPHGLDNEYGVDEEFMVLELRPGSLERVSGLVTYAPEFAEVS
jgi:putative acetyltransferase